MKPSRCFQWILILTGILCFAGCARQGKFSQGKKGLRDRVLQAVDQTIEAHRRVLTADDIEALKAFKEAFAGNPDPFDVKGLYQSTLGAEQGELRGPVYGMTNYRVNPDKTLGQIDVAIDEFFAETMLQLAEEHPRYRDMLVGITVREGRNVITLSDPNARRVTRDGIAILHDYEQFFSEAEIEEAARVLEGEGPRDLARRSQLISLGKQTGAFVIHREYLGFRAQMEFYERVGLSEKESKELDARLPSSIKAPGFFPVRDEFSAKQQVIGQFISARHPVMEGLKQNYAIEGSWDFLIDPDCYEPKAILRTIDSILKSAHSPGQRER